VLGQRDAGAFARACRGAGLAAVVACTAFGAAAPAVADRGAQPDPSELWRAYPLEQKPSTVAESPPTETASTHRNPPPASASDGGPAPGLIAAIGFAAALLVAAAVALRRRQRDRPAPAGAGGAPRAALVAAPPAQRAIQPAGPAPAPTAPRSPAAARKDRAAAARKTPVCQVRWNARGHWFSAVCTDAAGVERLVAASARLEWHRPGPPDETPEARAALRDLAKDLREQGWRPLRAKGIDFEERRWYARRFRRPTEAEAAAAARSDDGAEREVTGRTRGSG